MISVVALAAFSIGAAFNVFDHVHDWLERRSPIATDNVLAVLTILAAAFAVFGVRALKRAEREGALREETERRYRAMVEQVPSVSYTWNPSTPSGRGSTVYVSPQIERLLGYSAEEWVSSPTFWIERIHSDDRARVVRASEQSDRSGAPFRQDYRMIAKDGRIVWIRDESMVVSTDPQSTAHVQGVMYDITEQKEAEERIQEAENRYRTMVERVPAVAYTWDSADGVGEAPLLYISPQIERLLGFTAAEWMSDPSLWSRCAHPDDRQSILEDWANAVAREETFMGEYRLRTADGRWLWVRDEAVPVSTGSRGRPIYQGVMFDITQQKHAEQRYRQLVSELPVVTYLTDGIDPNGDHPMPFVSPGIEQLTGRPAAEWMTRAQTWAEMIHPDDRDRVLEEDHRTDRSGEPFEAEYRFLRDDGEVVWVRDTAVLVERDGSWPVWQGVIEDITVRRQTESRLREAEERFRALVEQIPALTYIEDPESGALLYMSPQVETLLGFRADEYDSGPTSWRNQLHPDDRDRVLASDAAIDTDQRVEEYRTIAKDGRTVWVHNEAVLLRDDEGHPRFWLGVIVDTTERMEAEERLRAAQDRYRYLVERLPTTVYVDAVDDLSTALYISPQYEALTGYSPDERLSDPGLWLHMLHEEDRDRVLAESNRTNATGDPFDVEYRIETKDGRTVWLHDLAYLVEGQNESPCWQGVLTDITERKLAEEAISRRDEILKAVGHAAERFLGASSWTDAIGDVLAHLGRAGDASRAAVYRREQDDDGREGIVLVEEWAAPGVEALAEQIGDRLFVFEDIGLSRWSQVFASGELINSLTVDLPSSERAALEHADVQTIVAIPIVCGGEWWGHLVYDQTREARVWQQAEIDALRVVANTLGAAVGREKAARILSETEARYQTLIEQIPAITYIDECHEVDDARIWPTVYISPQVETILGYSPEEWRDDPGLWAKLIHPDDLESSIEADRRHYESGEPLAMEIRLMAKDGSFHWLRDEAIIVRDEAGRPLWSQGILLDITERKSAEEHLLETETRYRTLIETMPAATYIDSVDALSQPVYVSPQMEQMYGYTPEEWKSRPELWEQGLHPDDHDRVVAAVERHNRDGTPYEAEYRYRHRDGRWVWVHDQAVMLRDEEGALRFSQGVVFDITARREAEEQLREAEERFRAIVEHVPAGIYLDLPDTSMQTMYASPQLQDITGIPTEVWTSNPEAWVEILHEEDREEVLGRYLAAIAAQEPWSAEYRLQRHDGRTIWVHDETTLIRNDGRDAMLLGVISDITERKLAEHALRESEQREREAAERLRVLDEMKNTFLAAVSHELRSPLTAILGLALTLDRSEMAENDRNDLLERLAANARKLDRLLKDLLDIDRLNRGIVEPQYRVTDVGALARRTVESLDALADRSIMAFADPVVLSVDPAKVERIVENLLMNAARHTSAESTIWLRVRSEEGGVLIAVEDDGAGVPEELRQAIFEPFRQGPTSSPHAPGTGIGLSLVGRFAELHGGRAWVEEREGGGASFRVFLPAGPMKGSEALALGTDVPVDGSISADGRAEAG